MFDGRRSEIYGHHEDPRHKKGIGVRMKPKTLFRALYFTFQITRCDDCKLRKPAFLFPVKDWNDISICRRCWYKSFTDEHEKFNLLRDIVYSFKESLEFVQRKERVKKDE